MSDEGNGVDCREAVERVYEYLDGELDASAMEAIRQHIRVCQRCYPYFNFERIFLDHLRSKGRKDERSESLERRVRRLLREEAESA
ncbi:MAG: zf-HC2 domain-containing protein [Gemmatimonadota bacterium]|nr:zf-HC2 domain-containing protein [Gemmatimonadota bacterium]